MLLAYATDMNYQWILFDADGTLFDYDKTETNALANAFAEAGHAFDATVRASYREINRQIWLAFERGEISQQELRARRFEQLFAAIGVEEDPESFSEVYLRHLADGTDLIEGAEEILEKLSEELGLMLITNGLKDVQRPRLAKSTIHGYFKDVVISDEIGSAKPAPEIFDVAFERMDDPHKDDVLIVGDSLTSDIRGGRDYGIDTCWFNPDRRPREPEVESRYEISSLDELSGIVGLA